MIPLRWLECAQRCLTGFNLSSLVLFSTVGHGLVTFKGPDGKYLCECDPA